MADSGGCRMLPKKGLVKNNQVDSKERFARRVFAAVCSLRATRSYSVHCATISEGIGSEDLAMQLKSREDRDSSIKITAL